jgi:hypothetical protein
MASRARAHTEVPSHVGSRAGVVELPTVPRNRPLAPRGGAAAADTTAKRHEVLGLVTLAAGVLLALAVGSYDARGGGDWCGPIGAAVAESLVAQHGTA